MTSCQQIVTPSFLRFMANLEQTGGRILDAQYVKLTFSLKITFYLTNTENRTKKSLTQFSHYCFEERYCFCRKMLIFSKKMLTSVKLGGPRYQRWYQKVYFLKLYLCEYLCTKFLVSSIILTSFRQGIILTPHLKTNS